jgi:hypothetical protein
MSSARYSCQILMKLLFPRQILEEKTPQISNFMKIRPLGSELLCADGRTDRKDETNSGFSMFGLTSIQYKSENSPSAARGM